jgi:hypothetical protein
MNKENNNAHQISFVRRSTRMNSAEYVSTQLKIKDSIEELIKKASTATEIPEPEKFDKKLGFNNLFFMLIILGGVTDEK